MFKIQKTYESHLLHDWSEPVRLSNSTNRWIRGENGGNFVPKPNETDSVLKLKTMHNYNLFASEHMSLHRSLPDHRFPECRNILYPEKLPTTSIIIVFHNEAWSALLRTVWSIIDRSPRELIEEIILVDDFSTWKVLKRPLDDYIEMLPVRIKIIRTTNREGLIRARLIGAKTATGNVLTFFDAHMECTDGWLQPILSRIASDRSVVTVPLLDGISSNDMNYYAPSLFVNGLRWFLIFHWFVQFLT